MNNLVGDEFGCLDALKIMNCDEKKEEMVFRSLYIGN